MKIVVIGGSGLIGSKLVTKLGERGHRALAASPSSGVNVVTGEGLSAALVGADVVVNVANSPSFEAVAALTFFESAGRNLVAAEARAGVKHHVALSVVGTERLLDMGYFRAKLAQETLIKTSSIPFTIVRATQFFEFIGSIAQAGTSGGEVRVPSALMQPIAAEDVACALAGVALSAPKNGTLEVAGPEPFQIDEIVRQFLADQSDARDVITDNSATYFELVLKRNSLMPGADAHLGRTRFADWLRRASPQTQTIAG